MASNYRRHYDQMGAYSPRRIAYLASILAQHTINMADAPALPQMEHYSYVTRRHGGIIVYDRHTPGNPKPERVEVADISQAHWHIQDVNKAYTDAINHNVKRFDVYGVNGKIVAADSPANAPDGECLIHIYATPEEAQAKAEQTAEACEYLALYGQGEL
jgi:hypothetical protein